MQSSRIVSAAVAIGLAAAMASARGAENRQMSMDDCVQLALQKNLDIQIQRRGPDIGQLALSSTYGAYDPVFNVGYRDDFNRQPESLRDVGGGQLILAPQQESEADRYNMSLGGLLPSGLTYNIGVQASDTEGLTPGPRGGLIPFSNSFAFAGIDMRQPLLKNFWIDGNRLSIALSKRNLRISELTLKQQVILTVTAVVRSYYQLMAARDAVRVQEVAVELAEQLLRENRKRVEVGVLAPLDEKQAESQVAANRAALLGAKNSFVVSQNNVKNLISDDYGAWNEVMLVPIEKLAAIPETFSRQDSWAKALEERPDVQQAKLDLEKRNITIKYDKNQLYPSLDLIGSYGRTGSSLELSGALSGIEEGSGPSYSYGVQLSFPLSNRTARQRYRIDKEEREQALLQLKKLEQSVMVEIDRFISSARTSLQQVAASRAAVEFARQALEAEQKKLENGKSTSFQVLQLQRELTAREYELITSLTTYNIALADLAQSEGTTLDRSGITVEIR